MMKRSLTLLLIGAGFAGGMTVAMSCNIGKASHDTEYASQDKGKEKHEGKEQGEEDEKDEDEQKIDLAKVPAPVKATASKYLPDLSKAEVTTEEKHGSTFYGFEGKGSDGNQVELDITPAGDVLQVERYVSEKDVPAAMKEALAKRFAGSKIAKAESVEFHYYKIDYTVDGKKHRVAMFADGRFAEDDDEGGEEHENH